MQLQYLMWTVKPWRVRVVWNCLGCWQKFNRIHKPGYTVAADSLRSKVCFDGARMLIAWTKSHTFFYWHSGGKTDKKTKTPILSHLDGTFFRVLDSPISGKAQEGGRGRFIPVPYSSTYSISHSQTEVLCRVPNGNVFWVLILIWYIRCIMTVSTWSADQNAVENLSNQGE